MEHRNVQINIDEGIMFHSSNQDHNYTVDGRGKVFVRASCRFGTAFVVRPQDAVDCLKNLIDRNLDGVKDV